MENVIASPILYIYCKRLVNTQIYAVIIFVYSLYLVHHETVYLPNKVYFIKSVLCNVEYSLSGSCTAEEGILTREDGSEGLPHLAEFKTR